MTATLANGPGNPGDCVGLFATGAPDATCVDWMYLNGSRTGPGTGATGATLIFTLPPTPGTYNLRFFLNDTTILLAQSATIAVSTRRRRSR